MKCYGCGAELGTADVFGGLCQQCKNKEPEPLIGWKCPVCGLGNAPFTDKCQHCKPEIHYEWAGNAGESK